ncbi:hypothetical protein BJ165DRAFT_1138745 [Panaeolus papilionaceus]|nr:hypothetical protein BJ165DRAFT_1138745 [Panaeolus papilionaceus]
MVANLRQIMEHARGCSIWFAKYSQVLEDQHKQEVEERRERIVGLLKEMGYGDQIAKMSDLGFRLPQFHPDIEAICERKLKDEDIRGLKPVLEQIMRLARDDRQWRWKQRQSRQNGP